MMVSYLIKVMVQLVLYLYDISDLEDPPQDLCKLEDEASVE